MSIKDSIPKEKLTPELEAKLKDEIRTEMRTGARPLDSKSNI